MHVSNAETVQGETLGKSCSSQVQELFYKLSSSELEEHWFILANDDSEGSSRSTGSAPIYFFPFI